MSCCGSRRPSLATGLSAPRSQSPARNAAATHGAAAPLPLAPARAAQPTRVMTFEYTGPASLSVRSSATGRQYHFAAPGARQTVDVLDWTQMFRISDLRHVG
jgi:hypothetical protein